MGLRGWFRAFGRKGKGFFVQGRMGVYAGSVSLVKAF